MKIDQVLRRTVIRLTVTAVVLLSAATVLVAPAQASSAMDRGATRTPAPPTIADVDTSIVNWATSRCLDGSASQGVQLKPCNNSEFQQWTISSNRVAPIHRFNSDLCLDGSVSQGVQLNPCNGSAYQRWDRVPGESLQIRHPQSGRCLDGSVTAGVRLRTCNNGDYQAWVP